MESSASSTTTLLIQRPKVKYRNEYNLDMWYEVKRLWLVGGVLLAALLASVAPRLGAPGGPLRTEYLSHVPLWYIYYASGRRWRLEPARLGRLPVLVALHAHVVAPALCVVVVEAFRDGIDHRVVRGAILSSVGGPCSWLSLALTGSGAAPLVATSYVASLFAVPLSLAILCGRVMLPPLGSVVASSLSAATPFLVGVAHVGSGSGSASRDTTLTSTKCAALLLLYAECCARLRDAEGSLNVGDVLVTLLLVSCYAVSSACACAVYCRARLVRASEARLLALCAVPKCLDVGWITSAACIPDGMARLPPAFLCIAHALCVAAAGSRGEEGSRGRGSYSVCDEECEDLPQ